jgi:hypothetical protein
MTTKDRPIRVFADKLSGYYFKQKNNKRVIIQHGSTDRSIRRSIPIKYTVKKKVRGPSGLFKKKNRDMFKDNNTRNLRATIKSVLEESARERAILDADRLRLHSLQLSKLNGISFPEIKTTEQMQAEAIARDVAQVKRDSQIKEVKEGQTKMLQLFNDEKKARELLQEMMSENKKATIDDMGDTPPDVYYGEFEEEGAVNPNLAIETTSKPVETTSKPVVTTSKPVVTTSKKKKMSSKLDKTIDSPDREPVMEPLDIEEGFTSSTETKTKRDTSSTEAPEFVRSNVKFKDLITTIRTPTIDGPDWIQPVDFTADKISNALYRLQTLTKAQLNELGKAYDLPSQYFQGRQKANIIVAMLKKNPIIVNTLNKSEYKLDRIDGGIKQPKLVSSLIGPLMSELLADAQNIAVFKPITGSGLNNDEGLYDSEIVKLLERVPSFMGTISADEIPLLPYHDKNNKLLRGNYSFIINTDPANKPGQHWCACFINDLSCEFYNSLADGPTDEFTNDISEFVAKLKPYSMLKYKVNRIKDQSNDTESCGWHAARFILNRESMDFRSSTGFSRVMTEAHGEKAVEKMKKQYRRYGFI